MFKNIYLTAVFLSMIIASGSVYTLYGSSFPTIIWAIFSTGTYFFFKKYRIKKLLYYYGLFSIVIFLLFLVFYFIIIKASNYDVDIFRLILLFFKFSIATILVTFIIQYKINYIKLIYIASMVIMFHADIGFLLQFIINPLNYYSTQYSNDSMYWYSLFNVFFYSQYSYGVFRSQGIMWEPGILQFFINFIIYYNLFIKRSIAILILAILSLIATISSTGLMIFTLMVVFKVFKKSSLLNKSVTLLLLFVVLTFTFDSLVDKFNISSSISFVARLYDIEKAVYVISQGNLMGIGYNEFTYSKITFDSQILNYLNPYYLNYFHTNRGITNSFLFLGVYFGPFVVIFIILLIFKQRIFPHKKLFSIILFIFLASEPVSLNPFFIFLFIFMFIEIHYLKKPLIKNYFRTK